jgi:hypothetical protein
MNLETEKASLAMDAPCNRTEILVFSTACIKASTREVCPVPEAISVPFFANTIVFDFVFLLNFRSKKLNL